MAATVYLGLLRASADPGHVDLTSRWPAEFVALASDDIREGLRPAAVELVLRAERGRIVGSVVDAAGEPVLGRAGLLTATKHVCAELAGEPLSGAGIVTSMVDMVRQALPRIAPRVVAACRGSGADRIPALEAVKVQLTRSRASSPDFMIQFDTSWCLLPFRSGAVLAVPSLDDMPPGHRAYVLKLQGLGPDDGAWAVARVEHLISCFLVPFHELIHLLQTGQDDSDVRSYSAEHDASRLCGVLMLQVLRPGGSPAADAGGGPPSRGWPPHLASMLVCMMMGQAPLFQHRLRLAPAVVSEADLDSAPSAEGPPAGAARSEAGAHGEAASGSADAGGAWRAYREWTASFGLRSPAAALDALGCDNSHDRSMKDLVCIEGVARGGDDAETARQLLELALVGRQGDLYSEENRGRVDAAIAADARLAVTEGALEELWGQPPAEAHALALAELAPARG